VNENKLFSYVDNVELSAKMKEALIKGGEPLQEVKTLHRRGFAVLGGMAAVLLGVVAGGYIFLMNGGFLSLPPDYETDIEINGNAALENNGAAVTRIYEANDYIIEYEITVAVEPAKQHYDRSFWYRYGEDYILNIYNSLKYHSEFADFVPRFEPIHNGIYFQGEIPHEHIANNIKMYLQDSVDVDITALAVTLEQFVFDFLEYIAMPIVLIPEPVPIHGSVVTREDIRSSEIISTILALGVARAFVEGNVSELEMLFASSTPGLFDFVKDTELYEFILIGTEFDPITHEYLHYFIISADEGDGIFAQSNKWVMYTNGHQIQQFTPAGREIAKANQSWYTTGGHDDLVSFCYYYTTLYLLQPEEYRESYTERADSAATIDARICWETEDGFMYLRQPVGDYNPARAELVSIEETDQSAVRWITLDFFGDAGYMFLAETLQFEIVAEQYAWRLSSVETIYDNPDINVAFIYY
jgi:hypothetical protein